MSQDKPVRVLVAGLGNMGRSHALAYLNNPGYEIVGLVSLNPARVPSELKAFPHFTDFHAALAATKPDLASINTYTDTHVEFALAAFAAGAHVFLEKPVATTVDGARQVVNAARAASKKLLIGYILRHHPIWIDFIKAAREMGPPYVMRLNLNQQSDGPQWEVHKTLMLSTSPMVDCGVHYVDVMCQVTDAPPVQVRGMGVRLSDEIAADQVNYTHLQVIFADGSVGWYECGWGPMMSETAYFVKDIITPKGSISISVDETAKSADLNTHTATSRLKIHHAERGADGRFARADTFTELTDVPDHDALCAREQDYMLRAIREDIDLTKHNDDAIRSLAIVLASEESRRLKRAVDL